MTFSKAIFSNWRDVLNVVLHIIGIIVLVCCVCGLCGCTYFVHKAFDANGRVTKTDALVRIGYDTSADSINASADGDSLSLTKFNSEAKLLDVANSALQLATKAAPLAATEAPVKH